MVAQETARDGRPSRTPAFLVALGGVLLVAGSLMNFGRADEAGSGEPIRGIETADGKFFVFVGIALWIMVALEFSSTSTRVATAGVMFSIFGSLLVFYMSIADLFTLEDVELGLYLVIVGAALGAMGGTMSLLTYTRRSKESEATGGR